VSVTELGGVTLNFYYLLVLWPAADVTRDSDIRGIVVVITDELKDAVVAMMLRKDELDEQIKFVLFIRFYFTDSMTLLLFFCSILWTVEGFSKDGN